MSEMRVAIFADVHGNSIALEAVLADIAQAGAVDEHWFLGDAADLGYDPAGAVRRIRQLPGLRAVRGNADRESTTHPHELDAALAGFVDLIATDIESARIALAIRDNCLWTRGALTQAGQFRWLAELPVEQRLALPDGTTVLLVHGAPGTDEGTGIRGDHRDEEVKELLANTQTGLVLVGHTHQPLDRTVDGVRIWNPGSVGNPATRDHRAMWTLLIADAVGYRLERRFVPYDVTAMLSRLAKVHHPAESLIRRFWTEG